STRSSKKNRPSAAIGAEADRAACRDVRASLTGHQALLPNIRRHMKASMVRQARRVALASWAGDSTMDQGEDRRRMNSVILASAEKAAQADRRRVVESAAKRAAPVV